MRYCYQHHPNASYIRSPPSVNLPNCAHTFLTVLIPSLLCKNLLTHPYTLLPPHTFVLLLPTPSERFLYLHAYSERFLYLPYSPLTFLTVPTPFSRFLYHPYSAKTFSALPTPSYLLTHSSLHSLHAAYCYQHHPNALYTFTTFRKPS